MEGRRALERAAELGIAYAESVPERAVAPVASLEELRATFDRPLPDEPTDAVTVVEELARDVEPGLTQNTGGRYFGFVIGGTVPAATAADWLTTAWDQNNGLALLAPAASVVEDVAGRWTKELLGLPAHASFAFVTGCQMAHVTALAAARHHVLAQVGHDVERDGLVGAPPIRIVAGARRHGTLDRALRFLGIGTNAMRLAAVDHEGRMLVDDLRVELALDDGPTIVCSQAGEVSTGAFDDFEAIAELAAEHGAWHHVDGAFGLWAAVSPELRHLVKGVERADSWATDAHKWLNVPYDCGIAFCAHPESHQAAMGIRSSYLIYADEARDPLDWTPEHSRRARAFTVYAAIRSLGRSGIAEIVESNCTMAIAVTAGLRAIPGCELLNQVDLNQVLFRFESDEATDAVIADVQASGAAWIGGTTWDGRRAIRVSVSNWQTTGDDVKRLVGAITGSRSGLAASTSR